MLTPTDLTRKKDTSVSVVLHRFNCVYAILGDTRLYCFFEGSDDPGYYFAIVSQHFPAFETLCCNGKSKVLEVARVLRFRGIPKKCLAYFIDRDFDSPNTDAGIHETDGYSIENYYSNELFVSNLLRSEFRLASGEAEFEACLELFRNKQQEFHSAALEFNAWYFWFKTKVPGDKKAMEVNLTKQLPEGFIRWDFDATISALYSLDSIQSLFPKAPRPTDQELAEAKSDLLSRDLSRHLRGKYEVEFLLKYLRYLIIDANTKSRRQYLKKSTRVNFVVDQFLSAFSQYAERSPGVDAYLESLGS